MSNFVPHRRDPAPPTDAPSDPAGFAPDPQGRWTVSTRSVGELLTTDIRGDQLRVLLFSRPDGQAHFAVRIASLLDTAVDTADQDPGPHQIPPLLVHTMQVVVELIQDLAETTGEPASAVAFFGSAREVAFAHVGGATVEFDSTQGPVDVGWVSLSDPDSGGTIEARAFSMLSRPDLDVSLRWSYSPEDSGLDGVEVDAQWQGPSHVAVQVRTLAGEIVSSARAVGGGAGRGGFFAGWFEDLDAAAPASLGSLPQDPESDEDEPAVYDERDPEGHSDGEAVYDEPEGHDASTHEEPGAIGSEHEASWDVSESESEARPSGDHDPPAELPSPEGPGRSASASGVRVNLTTPAWEWPPRFPDLEGPVAGSDAHSGAKPVPEATAKSAKPEQKPVEPLARPAVQPPVVKPSRNAWRTHSASRRGEVSGERIYEIPDDDDPVSQGAAPTAESHADPEPHHRRDPAGRGAGSTPAAPSDASHNLEPDDESHPAEAAGAEPPRWSDQEEVEPVEPEPAPELEPAEPDAVEIELAVESESLAHAEGVEDAVPGASQAEDDVPEEPEPEPEHVPYVTTSALWNLRDLAGGSDQAEPAAPRALSPEPSADEAQAAAERAELLRRMGSADLMKLRESSKSESSGESAEPVATPVAPHAPLERESISASAVSSSVERARAAEAPAPAAERTRAFTSLEHEGLEIGTPGSEGAASGPRVPRRVPWPTIGNARHSRRAWLRRAPWAATLAVLFGFGWWIGVRPGAPAEGLQRSLVERTMIMVGLGGPRYTLHVSSLPLEAKISVDGRPTSLKTPADLEVKIGPHLITLTVPDYGDATFSVTGEAAQRVTLEASLSGSLQVLAPATGPPIEVTLDGIPQGYAPLRIMQLDPGPHDVEFAAPGQPTWAQTVRVPVRGNTEVTARPFDLPPTGLIEVRATFTDDDGTNELKGAAVFVDGERRGVTPMSLELTRGPHSIRASYRSEMSGVQVLDLPGGNQRYASFSFGLGSAGPRLELDALPASLSSGQSITLSSKLTNIPRKDLREMWLHVRSPEGTWRRYAMTMLESPLGTVGVVVFPTAMLDPTGQAIYYVSALSVQGEEYFTDLQSPKPPSKTASRRAPHAPERPDASPPTTAASSSPPTTVQQPSPPTTVQRSSPPTTAPRPSPAPASPPTKP